MTELLDTVASWPSLLLVIALFGFAPGFCLRLIVLAYPRDDPRRAELIARLYEVPRIERPLWVAEQLEGALFEGVPHRWAAFLRWFARRRTKHRPRSAAKLQLANGGSSGRDAVALIGALVVVAGLVWVVRAVATSDNPVNTATVYGAYIGAAALTVSLLALLVPWWWKGRRGPRSTGDGGSEHHGGRPLD